MQTFLTICAFGVVAVLVGGLVAMWAMDAAEACEGRSDDPLFASLNVIAGVAFGLGSFVVFVGLLAASPLMVVGAVLWVAWHAVRVVVLAARRGVAP